MLQYRKDAADAFRVQGSGFTNVKTYVTDRAAIEDPGLIALAGQFLWLGNTTSDTRPLTLRAMLETIAWMVVVRG